MTSAIESHGPPSAAWFVNLQADPNVEVQVKGDRFRATALVATPAEKPQLLAKMDEAWPDYGAYRRRTAREIPVVVLERS